MDSILTITEFVKKSFFLQLLVMMDSSSIAQEDVLPVQLVAEAAQVPLSVLLVPKTVSQSSTEFAKPNVEMDLLPELNNVMIETDFLTMAVHQPVKLKLSGPVLVNHQFVPTMVQLFVETEELKEDNNVMMETWSTMMDVQADVKEKLPQPHQPPTTLDHQPLPED